MNSRYIKPAARLMIWGVLLFIGGAIASGYLVYMGLVEQVSAPFGRSSDAGTFFAAAGASALAGLVGLLLTVVAGWRTIRRIDQRYEAWFSREQDVPTEPQADDAEAPQPEQVERLQNPQTTQHQQAYAQQYQIAPLAPQVPPRQGPQS